MGKNDDPSPVVQRRRLRGELRRIRQQTGETQEQVAAAMDWSLSKLIRIENGSVGISTNDLEVLLGHYSFVVTTTYARDGPNSHHSPHVISTNTSVSAQVIHSSVRASATHPH